MKPIRALFIGFGNVGQKVAEILFVERSKFPQLSDLKLSIVGIVTKSRGTLVNRNGVDVAKAIQQIREEGRFSQTNVELASLSGLDSVRQLEYDVLVELSTLSIDRRGEPAVSHIREALKKARHVVTANKGPLAFAYHELQALAAEKGCRLLHESTVMDGAPVFSLAREGLSGCRIAGLKGVLNSTTNFVLSQMERGESLDEAVKIAQQEGFAEADPRHDLEGWDAAAKITVLANALMGASLTPLEVDRQGITGLTISQAQEAFKAGKRWKLICRAWREDKVVRARVSLELMDQSDPIACVSGSGSVLIIETDLMGPILINQVEPTLYDTAYGVIQDLLNLRSTKHWM